MLKPIRQISIYEVLHEDYEIDLRHEELEM